MVSPGSFLVSRSSLLRGGQAFQSRKVQHRVLAAVWLGAAHLRRRLELAADRRAIGATEDPAAKGVVELGATHPRRLAGGHAGIGELMEGAMQQAPQPGRQIIRDRAFARGIGAAEAISKT
jgi:hypothetical protein